MIESRPAPKAGDPCPQCGGELEPRQQPTAEQRAAAANHENPAVLPPWVDTASEQQVAQLGVLFECTRCHYRTRIKADDGQ